MKICLPLVFILFFISFNRSEAQTFTSTKNGAWTSADTWTANNRCNSSFNSPPPTGGWGAQCPIDMVISHAVTFSGNSEFGAGYFRSITVKAGGTLKFSNDFVLSTGGSQYTMKVSVENGGKIEVLNGSFKFQRNALVDIQSGGIVSVKTLEGGGGNGGTLEVKSGGTFSSSSLINLNNGLRLKIAGTLNANKLTSQGGGNEIQVFGEGKFNASSDVNINGLPFTASEQSAIKIGGDLTVTNSGDSRLYIKGNSNFQVAGKTSIANLFQAADNAIVILSKDVAISGSGAALLEVKNQGEVLINGNLTKPQWSGGITVQNSGQLVICGGPSGAESGLYPPTSYANMNIAPSPAFYGGCRIMPVDFVSFTATLDGPGREANLAWTTAKEWQNSHFEIERSVDNIQSWEAIGEVTGNGFTDSPTSYHFTDSNLPTQGGRVFYRLKQVNFDETPSYSITQAIQVEALAGQMNWAAYPNPTDGTQFRLELKNQSLLKDAPIYVTLSTTWGQQELFQARSIDEINTSLQASLTQKISGIYVIKVMWGETSETLKIVKN